MHDEQLVKNHEENFRDIYKKVGELELAKTKNENNILHLQESYLNLIAEIKDLKQQIENVSQTLIHRLPGWATLLITSLCTTLGSIITGVVVYHACHLKF